MVARELDAMVCWMSERAAAAAAAATRSSTRRASARAIVDELEYRVDVNTLEHDRAADAARRSTRSAASGCARSAPLVVDPYARNRTTGSFILIDEATNDTVARRHDPRRPLAICLRRQWRSSAPPLYFAA